MARNINDYYNILLDLVRKQRAVFLSVDEFNRYMDDAQMDKFQEDFKPYGVNQVIHDSLRPFRIYYPFASDADGVVAFPSDYQHLLGSPQTVYGSTITQVTFIQEDEWVNAVNSQLRPATLSSPIARDTNNGFNLFPYLLQNGFFTYLRRPVAPVLVVTQVGRVITYDPVNSVQLEWIESYVNNILARALVYAGVNMSEQDIQKYAENYTAQTNSTP